MKATKKIERIRLSAFSQAESVAMSFASRHLASPSCGLAPVIRGHMASPSFTAWGMGHRAWG
jgi:hypothetical protein